MNKIFKGMLAFTTEEKAKQMMGIAAKPSDPWLQKWMDTYNSLPKNTRAKKPAKVVEEVFDAQDALVKHLASKMDN